MISKRKLINFLFLLAFPQYGVGSYYMFKSGGLGFSGGLFFAILPFLAIILIYLLDTLYKGTYTRQVNGVYGLCMAALLVMAISVQMGLVYHSPQVNPINRSVLILLTLAPYNAAVIVQLYNREHDGFDMAWMVMKGLFLLIGVNLLGYAAGMRNQLHSFEGRISLPFMMGIYDSAHILALVNLILLSYMKDFARKPMRFAGFTALYLVNMVIILSVNSRLSFMIFFVLTILFLTQAIRTVRGLYTISLFTMPIMMGFAQLIYQILSLPFFAAILGRVDKQDVTTFNGRTYIWESAADWALHDRRGFLMGNGYNGQYHIHLLERVAKLWNEPNSYMLHMHSAFLEILVNQGILGLGLMYVIYWQGYTRYRREYRGHTALGTLFAGFTYLMFAWQIDIFGYGFLMGYMLLFIFMAPFSLKPSAITGKRKDQNGEWLT